MDSHTISWGCAAAASVAVAIGGCTYQTDARNDYIKNRRSELIAKNRANLATRDPKETLERHLPDPERFRFG